MSRKALQIYRNNVEDVLRTNKEDAISDIKGFVQENESDMSDGEIIAQRYTVTEGEETIIKTLLGAVAVKNGQVYLTIYESLEDVMKIIVDNELVTEKSFEKMNESVGLDEHMQLSFGEDTLLKDCKSIKEALLKLSQTVNGLDDKYVQYENK